MPSIQKISGLVSFRGNKAPKKLPKELQSSFLTQQNDRSCAKRGITTMCGSSAESMCPYDMV